MEKKTKGETKSPKAVIVFGHEVKLRGDLDRKYFSWGEHVRNGTARGKVGEIIVDVRRRDAGYDVSLEAGHICVRGRMLESIGAAIVSAERQFTRRLAKDEASIKAARRIVGRRS